MRDQNLDHSKDQERLVNIIMEDRLIRNNKIIDIRDKTKVIMR